MEHELEKRLMVALDDQHSRPEWDDVMHRTARVAPTPGRARFWKTFQKRPRLLLAACAILGILVAAPAFGMGTGFLPFFGGDKAPSPVVQDFASFNVGAPAGMAPGVIASETRAVPLSDPGGHTYTVWVAPTQAGGFCRLLEGSGGGCDRDREVSLSVGFGKASPSAPALVNGSVLSHDVSRLELRYQDGAATPISMTWVSKPIDAAFFVAEIPASHQVSGSRPVEVVALNSNGDVLLRNDLSKIPWNHLVSTAR